MNKDEWITLGLQRGFCGPPVCEVHDGMPRSWTESEILLLGEEICIDIIRLYPDEETKQEVEENHAASTWRKEEWLDSTQ